MIIYLLKFSACLTVFWLIYLLFLERQNMHPLKRYYLLVALASALVIPRLTLNEYVEPTPSDFQVSEMNLTMQPSVTEQAQVKANLFSLETVLWMLYGLGVFVFAMRFLVNLFKMYKRISAHEKIEKHLLIYVLLEECRIPHSFFKYLFFERSKYLSETIPDEVKLHEEAHAKQLHSLDIIAIELLQVILWFHPLIYVLKHHIKLNHEFLADQAVLDSGTDTKSYQNILLQFSSNAHEYQLSSAINYSSIKKRFTVMKTQTSKTRIWLSTTLMLPLVGILFYSFAERKQVEKSQAKINKTSIDDYESEKKNILKPSQLVGFSNKMKDFRLQEGASKKQVEEYNVWAKRLNKSDNKILKLKELKKYQAIYELMTAEQKKASEDFPQIPPPPPPPGKPLAPNSKKRSLNQIIEETPDNVESGYVLLKNGETHYYMIYHGNKIYYNKDGLQVDVRGKVLPPPPPPPMPEPTNPPRPSKSIKKGENIPPPSPPKSVYEFVKSLKNDDIIYLFNDEEVSFNEILKIAKDQPNISMQSNINNNKGYVKFWNE